MAHSAVEGQDWDERGLRVAADVEAGQWILDQVHNFDHTVVSLVPPSFPAYARVFHPASSVDEEPVRWADVAAANGTVAHPVMEWGSIVGGRDGQPGLWADESARGSLPPETARTLATVLRGLTSTPDSCWFAHWEGSGYLTAPEHWPRLRLPGRDMILFSGAVEMADTQFGSMGHPHWGMSAHLWWPQDHAWCVATDIDLRTTYLGASEDCVAAVLANTGLEALRASPDQRVTWDSDTINPLPTQPHW